MKRTTTTLIAAGAIVVAPLAALATPSAQDIEFAKTAAQGGMAEVADATIARSNGKSSVVTSFAAKMLADHGKANATLMSIARAERIVLPSDIGPVDSKAKGTLEGLHGTTFDTTYLQMQRQSHAQTEALFEKEIARGSDARLVAFAKATLPTVVAHMAVDRKDLGTLGTMSSPAGASMKKSKSSGSM